MKMKLGLLLCVPALMLAACDNAGGSTEVSEEDFKKAVLEYGFIADPANATYTYSNTATVGESSQTTTTTIEVDGKKVHYVADLGDAGTQESYVHFNNLDAESPTYDTYYFYSDQWHKGTSPFKGYAELTGYFMMAFTGIEYSDFTYDSESKAYKLNSEKEVVVDEHQKFTYKTLSLYLVDGRLDKAEGSYASGEGQYASTGTFSFTSSKLGETSIALPEIPA